MAPCYASPRSVQRLLRTFLVSGIKNKPPRSHTPETMTGCVAYPDAVARTHRGAEASSGARPSLWLFFGRLVGRYNPPHTKAHRTLGPTPKRRTGREAHRKVVLTHLEGRLRATALYGTAAGVVQRQPRPCPAALAIRTGLLGRLRPLQRKGERAAKLLCLYRTCSLYRSTKWPLGRPSGYIGRPAPSVRLDV
jgi:hypothetical protein